MFIYADQKLNNDQMEQIRLGLLDNLDVSIYTKHEFTWTEMEEIRKGLKYGLDVSIYAKPEYDFAQMKEIRFGLEDGVVDGINFKIEGNGINKTVTTKDGGKIQIDKLKLWLLNILLSLKKKELLKMVM